MGKFQRNLMDGGKVIRQKLPFRPFKAILSYHTWMITSWHLIDLEYYMCIPLGSLGLIKNVIYPQGRVWYPPPFQDLISCIVSITLHNMIISKHCKSPHYCINDIIPGSQIHTFVFWTLQRPKKCVYLHSTIWILDFWHL